MLSKKMAVSLTSLITILALAFGVMPAMAATFSVALDLKDDVSAVPGLQVVHPNVNDPLATELVVTLKLGERAKLKGDDVFATSYDKDGDVLGFPTVKADPEDTATIDAKVKLKIALGGKLEDRLKIAAVGLKIAKEKITPADPLSEKKSVALNTAVMLLPYDDTDGPMVYSIERVGVNFRQLKTPKINPTDNEEVQVRVTLSEYPNAFGPAHISAPGAAVTKVDQLIPVDGISLEAFLKTDAAETALGDDFKKPEYRKRMVYDEDITASDRLSGDDLKGQGVGDVYTADGSNHRLDPLDTTTPDSHALRQVKEAARKKHGGLHRAINEAKILTGTAYKYKFIPALAHATNTPNTAGTVNTSTTDLDPAAADKEFGALDGANGYADPGRGYYLEAYSGHGTSANNFKGAPPKPGDPKGKPTAPDPSGIDFSDTDDNPLLAAYLKALAKYASDFEKYRKYQNAKTLYEGYMTARRAEMAKDDKARADFYEKFRMDNSAANTGVATGADGKLYPYLVTLTPAYLTMKDIVVTVKSFEDKTSPVSRKYVPPIDPDDYKEGIDKLTIEVGATKAAPATTAGIEVVIGKGVVIPKDGYLVVAKSIAGSAVRNPGTATKAPANPPRKPFGLTYNLVEGGLPNLETFLVIGGTIDVVGAKKLVISEIMWGSDASITNSFESQYIELYNASGAAITVGDKDYKLVFYPGGTALPAMSQDRVGTVGVHGHWPVLGKGRSGRTGVGESPGDVIAVTPTQSLISMQRTADAASATGLAMDGTDPMSWGASTGQPFNFDPNIEGIREGSPGRAPSAYPTAPTPTVPTPKVPVAKATEIDITEIMVDTNDGRLPQWIELTSSAVGEVSLEGWEMVIDNAIDADVFGGGNAITVSLAGPTLDVSAHPGNTGKGQSVLVVAWDASVASVRHSANIREARVINLAEQLNQKKRYRLLSTNGFRITLVPPRTGAFVDGDIAGNLHEDWEIPMDDGTVRSSLIRRGMLADGTDTMGTDLNGWVLASETSLVAGQRSYYGDDEDAGTPGQDAGGPLPVELSHFRPARDKATGAVVITWATQSELNNAGFFIKRSNQKDGEFKVINATMIAGAGTTSEKQFYTYTDTTAQPNVVYYYQIEDVSLDGNRQLLTRGTRLKGHIGAAGKATVIWGELKASNE